MHTLELKGYYLNQFYSCSIELELNCNLLASKGRELQKPPRLQNTSFAGMLKNS